MKDKRAQQFMWSLGYTNSLGVSSEGQSGGLDAAIRCVTAGQQLTLC
jgi:hypothetical protein